MSVPDPKDPDPKDPKGLDKFLNKVKNLPAEYHQQFILAGYHYLRALREVGIDTEMVFIRLVSAIEALSQFIELTPKEEPLKGNNIDDVINNLDYTKKEKEVMNNIFETRKSGKKFAKFIIKYSTGYFKGGNLKAKRARIKKADLPKVLSAIYSARSNYLHKGEPMYLSMPTPIKYKWDIDPSLGMIIGGRKFSVSKKLPYPFWFEGLVRHCLINFLEEKTN